MTKYLLGFLALTYACVVHSDGAESFIANYLSDFEKNNDVAAYFTEKPQFIFGAHTHTPESSLQASRFIQDMRTKLAASGYSTSHITETKVLASIDSYRLIAFSLTRVKQDGTELDKVCSTYGILNTEQGYKILSWQPSQPDNHGRCW
ncbi:DUF6841 family protein [Rheinheimera fenheensis]|uniref:DUF6841 family protein n=1 Tax=Rheinheimera fenheensis TaxID=3152295 RepID=UPI00325C9F28